MARGLKVSLARFETEYGTLPRLGEIWLGNSLDNGPALVQRLYHLVWKRTILQAGQVLFELAGATCTDNDGITMLSPQLTVVTDPSQRGFCCRDAQPRSHWSDDI